MKVNRHVRNTISAVEHADLKIARDLADHRHKPEVRQAGRMSELADQPPLVALSVAVILAGMGLRHRATLRTGGRMLAAHALATGAKTIIKRSIDRTRPDHALHAGYRAGPGNSDAHELSSFPSGHTAGAVAVAQAVAREAPVLAAPVRLLALAVAIVQLPRAKHYASDVVVGAAIGWAGERAASAALDRLLPSGDPYIR